MIMMLYAAGLYSSVCCRSFPFSLFMIGFDWVLRPRWIWRKSVGTSELMSVPLIYFVFVPRMTGYLHVLSFVHPHRHPCGDNPYLLSAPVRISVSLLIIPLRHCQSTSNQYFRHSSASCFRIAILSSKKQFLFEAVCTSRNMERWETESNYGRDK